MTGWLLWVFVAAVFTVGEVTLATGFWLAPFALGATLAALTDLIGLGEPLDVVAFLAGTVAAITGLRPLVASRLLHPGPALRTGGAALVGSHATVLEPIGAGQPSGTVRIGSEVWSARAYLDETEIPTGTDVQVIEIRGATALVAE